LESFPLKIFSSDSVSIFFDNEKSGWLIRHLKSSQVSFANKSEVLFILSIDNSIFLTYVYIPLKCLLLLFYIHHKDQMLQTDIC
jgi:hypothetical protein